MLVYFTDTTTLHATLLHFYFSMAKYQGWELVSDDLDSSCKIVRFLLTRGVARMEGSEKHSSQGPPDSALIPMREDLSLSVSGVLAWHEKPCGVIIQTRQAAGRFQPGRWRSSRGFLP